MCHEVDEEWDAHQRTGSICALDEEGDVASKHGDESAAPLPLFSRPRRKNPARGTDIKAVEVDSNPEERRKVRRKNYSGAWRSVRRRRIACPVLTSYRWRWTAEGASSWPSIVKISLTVWQLVAGLHGRRLRDRPPWHSADPQYHGDDTANSPNEPRRTHRSDGLPAELLILADTFNQMLGRLEQSFDRLSRFSADIAHELRTPVNNDRGEIEVALAKSRTADQYRDVLGSSIEDPIGSLESSTACFSCARAENPQIQVEKEDVDLGGRAADSQRVLRGAAASEKRESS